MCASYMASSEYVDEVDLCCASAARALQLLSRVQVRQIARYATRYGGLQSPLARQTTGNPSQWLPCSIWVTII